MQIRNKKQALDKHAIFRKLGSSTQTVNRKVGDQNQSAHRRFNSTETALFRLVSDLITESETTGNITLLSLLDMSEVFDTVDHALLFNKLAKVLWHFPKSLWLDIIIS